MPDEIRSSDAIEGEPVTAISAASSPVATSERSPLPWPRWLLIVGVHVALVVVWQAAVEIFKIHPFFLPSPVAMIRSLAKAEYAWFSNSIVTAQEIVGGYLASTVIGIGLALLFYWSRSLTAAAFPLFVTLNMIPKVALGPLIIMWLKYGVFANILIAFSMCIFPVLLNTLRGLREVEPDLLDLVRSLKGNRWQLFVKIQLPGSLPYIFSGLKVAAILAVAGAIVGEFLASDRGLGYLMVQAQNQLDTAAMMMAIVILTFIGVGVYLATVIVERFVTVNVRDDGL